MDITAELMIFLNLATYHFSSQPAIIENNIANENSVQQSLEHVILPKILFLQPRLPTHHMPFFFLFDDSLPVFKICLSKKPFNIGCSPWPHSKIMLLLVVTDQMLLTILQEIKTEIGSYAGS